MKEEIVYIKKIITTTTTMNNKIKGLRRPPPPLHLLTEVQEEEKNLPGTYLKDFRICVTCKRWCQAINNLGTLQCKFHPMVSITLMYHKSLMSTI